MLEDRSLPSTFIVSDLSDGGAGTLRQAILDANFMPDADTIRFAVTGTINLSGALPDLSSNIDIQGPGANLLTVRRNGGVYRIFTVASGTTVVLSGLTMTNGQILGGGGGIANSGTLILNNATISNHSGGGIWNTGTLTLNSCTIRGNRADDGGGIFNLGTLTLNNSTVSGNIAVFGGGGIENYGTVTLNNATVSGNHAFGFFGFGGGGIASYGGTLTLNNSTVTGNSNDFGGGGIEGGTLHARNTIFAANTAPFAPDLWGDLGSLGHNLIGNTQGGSGFHATDLLNVFPRLGPLQDNGGPTFTHALIPPSPALDAGDNTGAPATDQRGFQRVVGIIDIGAYEVQRIVDDGDSGFSVTAGWFTGWTGQGYENDVSFAAAGDGSEVATWTFTGLTSGLYRVSVTWSEHANRATNTPFTILDGTTPLGTVRVNQERAPHHFIDNGRPWFNLGGVYSPTSGTLTVRLTNDADEFVIADAVRVERLTIDPVQVIDDGDAGFGATAGFFPYDGQGYQDDVAFAAPGDGSEYAYWVFTGLAPGTYRISITWSPDPNRATDALFYLFDGETYLDAALVNQELGPDDFAAADAFWEDLGAGVYTITGDTLVVVVTDLANEYVIADAIRIERLS